MHCLSSNQPEYLLDWNACWRNLENDKWWFKLAEFPYEFQYQSLGVSDIAVDPTNPNILYIATGDGDRGSLSGATSGANGDTKSIGVLKSIDGGITWSQTAMNWTLTDAKLIRRLIINPVNSSILIAATSDGIWRTSDAGLNWFRMQSTAGFYFMDVEFKPNDANIVYASSFKYPNGSVKIFRSVDGGITWNEVYEISSASRANIAVTPASPDLVDVAVVQFTGKNNQGLKGLWFSANAGLSFTQYYNVPVTQNDCGDTTFQNNSGGNLLNNFYPPDCGGQGEYDLAYAINPNNSNEIWLGGVNSWKSVDGGTSWTLKNYWVGGEYPVDTVHADKHFIAYHPLLPNVVYECNDGGSIKRQMVELPGRI